MEKSLTARALLVQVAFYGAKDENSLVELKELSESAGAEVVESVVVNRKEPDSKFFIGSGKIIELAEKVKFSNINLVIFNHTLTPTQERNISKHLNCRAMDRNALILDIFALRAKSFEGRLQVELAQLNYLSARLVGSWTHLERQQGGIGLRGPGERQLEIDRRLLAKRVKYLNARLNKLEKERFVQRSSYFRRKALNVSLIGYTNAGKSTLFNALSNEKVYAANQLFATLDTTSRKIWLEEAQDSIVLTDTVGFIRHLPHSLVKAFHATLEISTDADLLIHVIDAASPFKNEEIQAVNAVLKEIGADSIAQIWVFNKMDLCPALENFFENQYVNEETKPKTLYLSAKNRVGLEKLRQILAQYALQKQSAF